MEVVKEKQEVVIEKVIMTKDEYNMKLREAKWQGRCELAEELRMTVVNFPYKLNYWGLGELFGRLSNKIMSNFN